MRLARRRLAFLSAAVLAVLPSAGIASAASGPAAGNRVWAIIVAARIASGLIALFPQVSD